MRLSGEVGRRVARHTGRAWRRPESKTSVNPDTSGAQPRAPLPQLSLGLVGLSFWGGVCLVDTLKGPGPFTVFAPTDEAFAKLPKATLEDLLKP